jgi:hypothetical protein
MEIVILIITVLDVAVPFLYVERIRHFASFFSRAPVVRDAAYGLAELHLHDSWRAAKDLNDGAGIEVIDALRRRYALVFSESRENYDAAMDLDQYSQTTRETLLRSVLVLSTTAPERRRISGFDAVQYEIDAVHRMTEIKYLHTAIRGDRAFHQIVAWAPRTCYSRSAFEKLIAGFREREGPKARPRQHDASTVRVVRPIGFSPRDGSGKQ